MGKITSLIEEAIPKVAMDHKIFENTLPLKEDTAWELLTEVFRKLQ